MERNNYINNPQYTNDRFIRIREVCNRTGFCMQTIRNAIKKKELRGYLINNRWYTTELDYDKYIANTFSKSMFGVDVDKMKVIMEILEKDEIKKSQKDVEKEKTKQLTNNSDIDTSNLDSYKKLEKEFYSKMMSKLQF